MIDENLPGRRETIPAILPWYNQAMISKVTPAELPQALNRKTREPVYLVDSEGNTTHVVLPVADARDLLDQWLRRELQVGFDQSDRGESESWDVEATLQEAHRRHAEREQQKS